MPFAFMIYILNEPSEQKCFIAKKKYRDILRVAIWKLSCARRTLLCLGAVLVSTVMGSNVAQYFNDVFGPCRAKFLDF